MAFDENAILETRSRHPSNYVTHLNRV